MSSSGGRRGAAVTPSRLARGCRFGAVGVALAAAGVAAATASARPLWFDEIFTYHIAAQPTVAALVDALGPMDPSPPLHYLLVRAAHGLLGASELATRLPALLAFLATSGLVWALVAPRAGPLVALAAVACLPLTKAYDYAYEARPYSLLLACAAAALLGWQAAAAGERRRAGLLGLFASLAIACYAHFYAFLVFIPIAVGEAVRTATRRRVDLPVWAAMIGAGIVALPLLPLLRECMTVKPSFWASPSLRMLGMTLWLYWPLASLGLLGLVASGVTARWPRAEPGTRAARPSLPAHEVAAAATLALLPVVAFVTALVLTNAFLDRYVLPAVLGGILLLAYATRWIPARREAVAAALLVVICGLGAARAGLHLRRALVAEVPAPTLPAEDRLPVVVTSPLTFAQIAHYAPGARDRLVFLLTDVSDPGSSVDQSVLGLGALLSLRVENAARFLRAHDRFWVYGPLPDAPWASRLGRRRGHASRGTVDGFELWSR
jgi:mannosyltransferase